MENRKSVELKPVYVELIPEKLEQDVLYISEKYEIAIHLCLCGCGGLAVTPIDKKTGWKLTKHENGKVSLHPSIGNYQLECKSHYILTENIAKFV